MGCAIKKKKIERCGQTKYVFLFSVALGFHLLSRCLFQCVHTLVCESTTVAIGCNHVAQWSRFVSRSIFG